jgi:VWA domain containing CoxE-like protein
MNRTERWRLILGRSAEAGLSSGGAPILSGSMADLDAALGEVYDDPEISREEWAAPKVGPHGAVRGRKFPRVAVWLNQIRNFFPKDVVVVVQQDAIERRGLKELLFEPELLSNVEPSLDLAAMVLELKHLVPEAAKSAARELVRQVVEELRKRLESELIQAVRGALSRQRHSPIPSLPNIDWRRTIRQNLKNYDRERRQLIPERMSFFGRVRRNHEWNIIIAMDQSGSMAGSLIYGGIMGAILASMPAVETHVVAFNHHDVVDLTEHCSDPVDLLFGVQLGGAEDYWMATCYCEKFIHTPAKTLYVLLADLHDTSANEARFVRKVEELVASGVRAICLLAISDQGEPAYNHRLADRLSKLGMPCFGCTPNQLPELLAGALQGIDLKALAKRMLPG